MTIKELQKESHDRARRKGFYDTEPSLLEALCLIHSEVSEATECVRDGDLVHRISMEKPGKPEGLPAEFADIVIRVADTCEFLGIDLEAAIRGKADYNETRPFRHGKSVR